MQQSNHTQSNPTQSNPTQSNPIQPKYKVIQTITEDAPFGDINWCTISFLTPNKLDKTKCLDVMGFKVYNGYNTSEMAKIDAQKLKSSKKDHDIYLAAIGKLCAWDDPTMTDEITYDNDKLNNLEKTRREHLDKLKVVKEQFKNEYQMIHADLNEERRTMQLKKMRQKLYDRGLISKQELDALEEDDKLQKKDIALTNIDKKQLQAEIEEAYQTDYLDMEAEGALKYGCLSIYSSKYIRGLKTLSFKIRGLFQTNRDRTKRVQQLKKLYPDDRIYIFEVGKWTVYTETENPDTVECLKQLNYAMKCYLENMSQEQTEFNERTEKKIKQTEQLANLTKRQNRHERRRDAKKKKVKQSEKTVMPQPPTQSAPSSQPTQPAPSSQPAQSAQPTQTSPVLFCNETDAEMINEISNFLDDPELRNKYPADPNKTETMSVTV